MENNSEKSYYIKKINELVESSNRFNNSFLVNRNTKYKKKDNLSSHFCNSCSIECVTLCYPIEDILQISGTKYNPRHNQHRITPTNNSFIGFGSAAFLK